MNRGQQEKRAFLDYRGRDLLVLKRVIMRYKTMVRRSRRLRRRNVGFALFLLRRATDVIVGVFVTGMARE